MLLDDLKERRGYSHLKKEALDRTMWGPGFGRGFEPVVRQTTKSIRFSQNVCKEMHIAQSTILDYSVSL
jgi:hypothetical protein